MGQVGKPFHRRNGLDQAREEVMQLRASIKAHFTDVSVESQPAPRVDAGRSRYVARTLPVMASVPGVSAALCAGQKRTNCAAVEGGT